MWVKKIKEKRPFGNSLSFGSRLIISSLVVSFLALSPLAALPWRTVNKMELKTQIQQDSKATKSYQTESLKSSEEVKTQQVSQQEKAENVLKNVDDSLESILKSLVKTEAELDHQISLTKILQDDNLEVHSSLQKVSEEKNLLVNENLKLKQEAYGTKLITEVSALYNLQTGFGIEGAIGFRFGPGAILKGGVSVPIATVMNPPQLVNINNYTFKATLGWEW